MKPVFHQHLLRTGHHIAVRLQTRKSCARHTPGSGQVRARVGGSASGAPAGRCPPNRRIIGVKYVNIRTRWKVRIQDHSEQAPISEVVYLRPQIGEDCRRRCRKAVIDLDDPTFLCNENTAIRRELNNRRLKKPGEDEGILKTIHAGHSARHAGIREYGGRVDAVQEGDAPTQHR